MRFTVVCIQSYGIESIAADPAAIVEWKTRRAEEFLSQLAFDDLDVEILAALSDYELLASDAAYSIFGVEQTLVVRRLRVLEEFCCVERHDGYYYISASLRGAIRKDKRFEKNDTWKQKIALAICAALEEYKDDEKAPVALIENATLASLKASGKTPAYLAALILPSHLLKIAREYYDNGKHKECLDFCKRVEGRKNAMSESAELELLRLKGLSAVRLSKDSVFEGACAELARFSSRTARRLENFLKGFKARMQGDLDSAEKFFLTAWRINEKNASVNRELASLYCRQRRYDDAERFARVAYNFQSTNPYIIDIMAEALLGKQETGSPVDVGEVARIIGELKLYGDAPGLSFYLVREAQRLRKNRDLPGALRTVTRAIEKTSGLAAPYFMRADVYISMNAINEAEGDIKRIEEILARAGGFSREDEARLDELKARVLIERRNFEMAKGLIDRSAFMPNVVQRRLYDQLHAAILFTKSEVSGELAKWIQKYKPTGRR